MRNTLQDSGELARRANRHGGMWLRKDGNMSLTGVGGGDIIVARVPTQEH